MNFTGVFTGVLCRLFGPTVLLITLYSFGVTYGLALKYFNDFTSFDGTFMGYHFEKEFANSLLLVIVVIDNRIKLKYCPLKLVL